MKPLKMKTEPIFFKAYKRYYTFIPSLLKQKRIRSYLYVILTFFTSAFFAVTAIKPTINTIIGLNRKIADGQEVDRVLKEKIIALSKGQQLMSEISGDLPIIEEAMPAKPNLDLLVKQVENLASASSVTFTSLTFNNLQLRKSGVANQKARLNNADFSFEIKGSYKNLITFLNDSHRLRRLLTLEDVRIAKPSSNSEGKELTLRATVKAYYRD
jgi:Tfp pilus assembly protein PilO